MNIDLFEVMPGCVFRDAGGVDAASRKAVIRRKRWMLTG